jgi:hypothetical protein
MNSSELTPETGAELSGLGGDVYTPSHPDYPKMLKLWNQRYSNVRPAIINVVKEPQHVSWAIRYARKHGLSVRIKAGGHSYEGFSVVQGGLVIDLRELRELTIDTKSMTCRFGPGWLQGDLYARLKEGKFVIAGGICDTVAAVPVFLGGGTGIYHRKLGLSCDTLLQVDLVTHDGQFLRCNKNQNADLFWACKGAGNGNFGVVVSATVRLFPARPAVNFHVIWRWDERVPFNWQRWLEQAPPEVANVTLSLGTYDSIGRPPIIECQGLCIGDYRDCGAALGHLLRQGPTPLKVEYIKESSEEVGDLCRGGSPKDPRREWAAEREFLLDANSSLKRWKSTGLLSRNILGPNDIRELGDLMARAPHTMEGFSVAFVGLGGQIDTVDPKATPYPHRGARYMLRIVARWKESHMDGPHLQFHSAVKEELAQRTQSTSYYFNYCDLEIPDFMTSYFGVNAETLRRIKRAYDPEDFFRYEQSIGIRNKS